MYNTFLTTFLAAVFALAVMKFSLPSQQPLGALVLLLCAHVNFGFCSPMSWKVGQTVQTASGSISGHAASNLTLVSEYLGIPYAQPPLGTLRFQAPQPYTSSGSFNASKFVSISCGPREWQWKEFALTLVNSHRKLFTTSIS